MQTFNIAPRAMRLAAVLLSIMTVVLFGIGCSSEAEKHYNLGRDLGEKARFQDAIIEFDEAIRLDPKHARAYVRRGLAYAILDMYRRAIQDFNEAIKLDPTLSEAYAGRGSALESLREYEKALQDYEEAIRHDPKIIDVQTSIDRVNQHISQYYQEIQFYIGAIKISPDGSSAVLYNSRGIAYFEFGRYEKAVQDYSEAIRIAPGFVEAYVNRAVAYTLLLRFD